VTATVLIWRPSTGVRQPRASERGEAKAVTHAVEHSFVREAVLPERKLLTEALKRGSVAVTVEGVAARCETAP